MADQWLARMGPRRVLAPRPDGPDDREGFAAPRREAFSRLPSRLDDPSDDETPASRRRQTDALMATIFDFPGQDEADDWAAPADSLSEGFALHARS